MASQSGLDSADQLAGRIAVEAESAADRLRTAIVLSRDLADIGEALVERFVTEARAAGMPWAEIGDLFGTSRQAAQQRYRQASAAMGAWPGRWTAAALRVLDRAGDEAQRRGHQAVGTEHVVLELVTGDGDAADVLADLGVTRERILAQGCVDAIANAPPEDCLGVRPRLKQALEQARRVADRLGHRSADTGHLLAGLLSVPDALAVEILARCDVGPAEALAALAERLDADASALAPARRRRRFARRR
jgi:Clp amino terminal domain, pathogenicity island component